jgi:hypothetical protein
LIGMLGYQRAPNGALIWNTIEVKYQLGVSHADLWEDTFESDWEELCDARDDGEQAVTIKFEEAIADVEDQLDASTSEPTESN